MAWRWHPTENKRKHVMCSDDKTEKMPDRPSDVPDSWEFVPYYERDYGYRPAYWLEDVESFKKRSLPLLGFCGLAGGPK